MYVHVHRFVDGISKSIPTCLHAGSRGGSLPRSKLYCKLTRAAADPENLRRRAVVVAVASKQAGNERTNKREEGGGQL